MDPYQEALDYIYAPARAQHRGYGTAAYDLSRMRRMLARLGDPQEGFQAIHIAGTKGKGSTAAFSEAILRAAGHRTGLFTSPHLHTFCERLRVDGRLIARDDLLALLEQCRPVFDQEPERTTFEVMTALAFLHFAQRQVAWAVIETGLGGRLDPTNVLHPAATAITSISYDHTEVLGRTLAQIASEKAGIIKARCPVVTTPQAEEAMTVIRAACASAGAPLITVGPAGADADWQWSGPFAIDARGQSFDLQGPNGASFRNLRMPLLGAHQLANASAAVALTSQLAERGVALNPTAVAAGLHATRWPGRMEVIGQCPWIVVDGAHNADSARKLCEAIQAWFPRDRLGLVFGASADKDVRGMLEALLPGVHRCVVTASLHPRAATPTDLTALISALQPRLPVTAAESVAQALQEMLAWAGPDDLILVTGSLFVVGAARAALAANGQGVFAADDWVYASDPLPPTG